MDCKTPSVNQMDEILSEKRNAGLLGIKLFVRKSGDCSVDDIARSYCIMEKADKNNQFDDITNITL
jgi:hypothetical protein